MEKQRRLIVAKYKEDVSWINGLKNDFDIIVYNKDNNIDPYDLNLVKAEYVRGITFPLFLRFFLQTYRR